MLPEQPFRLPLKRPVSISTIHSGPSPTALRSQRAMRSLFNESRFEEILQFADSIQELSPASTIAKAWEHVAAARIGDTRRLEYLGNFDENLLILKTQVEPFQGIQAKLDQEIASIFENEGQQYLTINMPFYNAARTGDIFALSASAYPYLRNLFTTAFLIFLQYKGLTSDLKQLKSEVFISAWLNEFSRDGDGGLGSHFHPGAWIGAIYYPHYPNISNNRVEYPSPIIFGSYPEEMGGGKGVSTITIQPQFGDLILFPSYLGHEVPRAERFHNRYSIACDLRVAFNY